MPYIMPYIKLAAQQQYQTLFLRLEREPFMTSPWRTPHICGSLGKKLAKDAREGGTEKLSRHGVVSKENPNNGSLYRTAPAFSLPELGAKFGTSSVFIKECGSIFMPYIGRIFRMQNHAYNHDLVCARHRQSDTAMGWERDKK